MKRTIITAGDFNLDEIFVREYPEGTENRRKFVDRMVSCQIGGNAGNVSAELAVMGWDVYPVVMFDESPQGHWAKDDLAMYGCNNRFVSCGPKGGTFMFRATHNRIMKDGSITMGRRAFGPASMFPKRHNITVKDEVPALLGSLDFVPDVFFFGSTVPGHRALAEGLRERGSLIYFENQNALKLENALYKSLELAHIIKMSDEHASLDQANAFVTDYPGKLFIQSMGKNGVRYNLRGQGWVTVPAVPANVVDAEGAGDAMTAAFINALPCLDVANLTQDQVQAALEVAQKASALAIQYYGSKGYIMNDPQYAHIAKVIKDRVETIMDNR